MRDRMFDLLLRLLKTARAKRGFDDATIADALNQIDALKPYMPDGGWSKESVRHFSLTYTIYRRPGPSAKGEVFTKEEVP